MLRLILPRGLGSDRLAAIVCRDQPSFVVHYRGGPGGGNAFRSADS